MAGDWFDEQGAPPSPGGGGGGDDWFTQQGGAGGAPPSAPSSAPASAPGGGGVDRNAIQAFISQWQASHAPSEGIGPLAAAVAERFPGVTRHMYGATPSNNELSINGEKYKVIGGEDSPTSAYWYIPGTDDSPGFGGGGGGGRGYYYDPAPNEEDYDAGYGNRLGYGGGLEMDPGYQFRLSEGAKALEHSAAAKGTLLTGGTLKGLARYAQDYASGEFQNRYQRLFGEQQNRYNQLSGLAGLGANAAAGQGGANTGYGNSASDLLTQQGNARAAGTVAQNQTSQNAINQGLNLAQMYYLSRLYGQGGGTGGGGTTSPPYSGYGVWQDPPGPTGR